MTFTQGSPLPRATFIRASAGTGKTFQLSNRYLRLLLAGQRPDSILASTFTRKAAGEILERVIQRLARAAASSAEATDLAGHLDAQQVERPEFARLLRDLLRRLDRCRISTLDSYYGQLARTYCLELGLPPAWSILDEAKIAEFRSEAIRRTLAEGFAGSSFICWPRAKPNAPSVSSPPTPSRNSTGSSSTARARPGHDSPI
ncbi:MAG: UvrD-helicase domain-containing protein [Pirellulaceae bacterium]